MPDNAAAAAAGYFGISVFRYSRILSMQQAEAGPLCPQRVSDEVMARLRAHAWPGNLRQLANVLRTAAIMAEGEVEIRCEHLPEEFADEVATPMQTADAVPLSEAPAQGRMRDWEAGLVRQALERHGGNVSLVARELGVSRNTIYRRLRGAQ